MRICVGFGESGGVRCTRQRVTRLHELQVGSGQVQEPSEASGVYGCVVVRMLWRGYKGVVGV